MSSFEDAAAGVSGTDNADFVDVEVKKRVYPIPDPGMYEAEIIDVRLFDSPYQEGQKIMKLMLELDKEYDDPEFGKKKYRVFSKPFSFMFGQKSSLTALCMDLTGRPPVLAEITDRKSASGAPLRRFQPNQFVGMHCQIVIKHATVKDKTYANIAAYLCSDAVKRENATHIPTSVSGSTIVNAQQSVAKAKKEEELPIVEEPKVDPAGDVKRLLAQTKTPADVDRLIDLLIEDSSLLQPTEKEELRTLAMSRKAALASA